MTLLFQTSRAFTRMFLFAALVAFSACRGGELCGPLSEPQNDVDADCVETDSDDCPDVYNPGQIDVDEDGVGSACDINDGDSSCGPEGSTCTGDDETGSISAPLDAAAFYPEPSYLAGGGLSTSLPEVCRAYLVACGGDFLGHLNADANDELSVADPEGDYGDSDGVFSIMNPLGFYGRDFTSCSAFNPEAVMPPAVFCESDAGEDAFAGFLTVNPMIENGLNACGIMAELGLDPSSCE